MNDIISQDRGQTQKVFKRISYPSYKKKQGNIKTHWSSLHVKHSSGP